MKIAVPTYQQKLCPHFGHCEQFAILTVSDKEITDQEYVIPPPHEPGVLPKWLNEEHQVNLIIAGGMGQRAQSLFQANNIETIVGAPAVKPESLVMSYLLGELETGGNTCDH
jgi:predicted Fe-Mo cluster-binding NifX family protein